jgi:hypothetical protein
MDGQVGSSEAMVHMLNSACVPWALFTTCDDRVKVSSREPGRQKSQYGYVSPRLLGYNIFAFFLLSAFLRRLGL